MKQLLHLVIFGAMAAFPLLAAGGGDDHGGGGHVSVAPLFIGLVLVLVAAKLGGELFERMGQPAVLGELVIGVVLGNLALVGFEGLEFLKTQETLAMLAEVGVALLLFEVGLESDLKELMEVGVSSLIVAVLGVVAPVGLGYGVSLWFLPDAAWYVHLFVGATLAATSVGITARVLKDIKKMDAKESKIILGAAVVDDVLGLIILAVITGIVASINTSGSAEVDVMQVLIIIGKAVAFLGGAILIGSRVLAGRIFHFGAQAKVARMPLVLSIGFCFLMAALAELFGLAHIVGAFAAGLVLTEAHYESFRDFHIREFEEIVSPIAAVFVPVFFVLMGVKVDLRSFGSVDVLIFAAALSMAAIIGKQVCSLGVLEKGLNKLVVGVGMIPRGEVGLIFAGMGAASMVGGVPVFGPETFSAMVVMVMVTTVATPPLLKALFK